MADPLLYLSRGDVEAVDLDMGTIIDLLEQAFSEKGRGHAEMPPKPGIHPRPDAFIHAMPAYLPALESAGIKWVGAYPENRARNLPYISGLIILNDPETGLPTAVMDCTWVTGMRTGGATGLAAKYLARPDSETAGILACGVQGRTNLQALTHLFDLRRVYAYDIAPAARDRFAGEMRDRLGLDIVAVDTPREAVVDSDLIVTSGPIRQHPEPTIPAGWVRQGAFASAVDFDSYWSGEALAGFDRLITDDREQFAYYREVGYFRVTPNPAADLGEIVTGAHPGREGDQERIITMNLGLAIDDMAVAPEIVRRARRAGIGTPLEP